MCTVCGCGQGEVHNDDDDDHHHHDHGAHEHTHADHDHDNTHDYGQGPAHAHAPGLSQQRMVQIEQDILGKNNEYAATNRQYFAAHGILTLNLVSSPGSGKPRC